MGAGPSSSVRVRVHSHRVSVFVKRVCLRVRVSVRSEKNGNWDLAIAVKEVKKACHSREDFDLINETEKRERLLSPVAVWK